MGEGHTIRREVRIFGALYCALFAVVSLVWIGRDLDKVDEGPDLWWNWVGLPYGVGGSGLVASSYYDLALLVLYVATGAIVMRSAVAGSALVTVALATIVLRLPSLWNLHSDWMEFVPDGLQTRAQLTSWAAVLVSVAVLVAVGGSRSATRSTPEPERYGATPPAVLTRPTSGGSGAAVFFLGGIGAVLIAWQIYFAQDLGWDVYERQLTGKEHLSSVLDQPTAWVGWFVAVLALVAGGLALGRAPFVRPLGLVAAFLVIVYAVGDVSIILKLDFFDRMDELPTSGKLFVYSSFVEVFAGLVALLALAPRGPEQPVGSPGGWGPQPAPAYGDGHAGPGGYGAAPGYSGGYQQDGYQQDGYQQSGYPQGSGQGGYPGYQQGHQGHQPGGPRDDHRDGYPGGQQGGGYPRPSGGYGAPPPPPPTAPPPPPPDNW